MAPSVITLVVCAAPLAERAPDIAAALRDAGWTVSVVVTPSASGWVDHDQIEAVTGQPAAVDYRRPDEPKRGPRPTAVVACPGTFNTLNKLADGVSDTYALGVLNEALATGTPLVVMPIVNERLWGHPAWEPNLRLLGEAGVRLLDAHTGEPSAQPVRSGTGADVAAAFQPSWLTAAVTTVAAPSV